MSYFNHAFNKVFNGQAPAVGATPAIINGFIATPGTLSTALTKGQFGFFNPKDWGAGTVAAADAAAAATACPLVLVAGSLYQNDKIGPFHGGYQETVKSKIINPKYVTAFYGVPPRDPQQMTISVGLTPFTEDEGTPNCDKQFLCGNNYYLRVDLKGAPELRFLSRNSYYTAMAYTGCCPAGEVDPIAVDPTTVYIQWATALMNSPLMAPFISITIYDTQGDPIGTYNKTTYDAAVRAGQLDPADRPEWDLYESPAGPFTTATAGMYIQGAYIDTQFGNCTFYPNDSMIAYLEPVKIYASEVDYNGDPCAFTGLCVANTCAPIQSAGFGEGIVRELILSEGYNQTPFYTGKDLRIREITQGYDVTNTIDRGTQYYRFFIQHSVPRFNNPSGTFDNDQYLLEIITANDATADATATAFVEYVNDWLLAAQGTGCVQFEDMGDGYATPCAEAIPQPTEPNPGALPNPNPLP
jgi:hypothetical protein